MGTIGMLVFLVCLFAGLGIVAFIRGAAAREQAEIRAENDRRILRARALWGGDDVAFYCRIDDEGMIRLLTPDEDQAREIVFGPRGSYREIVNDNPGMYD